jgi:hypothetical protein
MALDLNLEGLTPEQLRGALDFQRQLRGARAARTAGVTPPAQAPQITNTTAMSAARATSGPATGGAPTATNIAPVATAEAASAPGIGQRILSGAGKLARGAGTAAAAGTIGAIGAESALKTYETPTEEYEKRFGFGPSNIESPLLRGIRDLGVRSAGALTDLGETAMKFVAGLNPFSTAGAPAPKPASTTAAPAAAGLPTINAEALMRGTAVPAPGTGAFRRGRAAAVAVDSRGAAPEAPAVATAAAAPRAQVALPTLGTEGSIFSNLVQFQRDAATAAGGIAAARGQARAAKAAAEQGLKVTELGLKAEDVITNRMKAVTEQGKAGTEGRKVVLDLQGNPIIVDTRKSTALKPKVAPQVTLADIQTTAANNKMTPQQVVQRLITEGRIQPDDPVIAQIR